MGLRRCEIAWAEVGDLDLVERSVRIVGKGGHQRVVALTQEVERAIRTYLAETNHHAGPLVRDSTGTHGLTPDRIGRLWSDVAYRAGVKERAWDGVASHAARHTAGTDVAHAAGPIVARDLLGHANLSTTDRYIGGVDLETQRAAIEGRRYAQERPA